MWRRHRHLILLLALVGVVLLESSARRPVLGPVASDAFVTLMMLGVFLAVFQERRERVLALVAAAAAIAMNWSYYLTVPGQYVVPQAIANHVLAILFMGFAVAVILRDIFARKAITVDEVLGTACGYLLAAGVWAHTYAALELLLPGSFTVSPQLQDLLGSRDGRTALFNYFSLVTLTTMGYGDVTPARTPATGLAMLEAAFGQFYIAVVVAQLVGLRLAQAFGSRDPSS